MITVRIVDYEGHTIRVNTRPAGFEAVVYEVDEEVGGGGFAGDSESAALDHAKGFVDRRQARRTPLFGFNPSLGHDPFYRWPGSEKG
jgi:hypothetical protein